MNLKSDFSVRNWFENFSISLTTFTLESIGIIFEYPSGKLVSIVLFSTLIEAIGLKQI